MYPNSFNIVILSYLKEFYTFCIEQSTIKHVNKYESAIIVRTSYYEMRGRMTDKYCTFESRDSKLGECLSKFKY